MLLPRAKPVAYQGESGLQQCLQQPHKIGVTQGAFTTLRLVTEQSGLGQFGAPMPINVPVASMLGRGPPVNNMVLDHIASGNKKRKKFDSNATTPNATNNTPAVSGAPGEAAAAAGAGNPQQAAAHQRTAASTAVSVNAAAVAAVASRTGGHSKKSGADKGPNA